MISFHPVKVSQMEKLYPIIESVCINGMGLDEALSYLSNTPLMEITGHDGTSLGMLSVEPYGALGVEVHAYVLPEHRKRSKELLEAFKEAIFTLTPFTTIRTTVTGDFKPLVRFLSFIGFRVVGINKGVVSKSGMVHDLYVLETNKGD